MLLSDISDIANEGVQCQLGQLLSILTQKCAHFGIPKMRQCGNLALNRKNEQKMVIIFEDLKTPHFLGTGFWDPGFHQIGVVSRLPGPYRARILRPWIPPDRDRVEIAGPLIGAGILRPWIPPDWCRVEIAGPLIRAGFWGPGSHQIGIVSRLSGPYRDRIVGDSRILDSSRSGFLSRLPGPL